MDTGWAAGGSGGPTLVGGFPPHSPAGGLPWKCGSSRGKWGGDGQRPKNDAQRAGGGASSRRPRLPNESGHPVHPSATVAVDRPDRGRGERGWGEGAGGRRGAVLSRRCREDGRAVHRRPPATATGRACARSRARALSTGTPRQVDLRSAGTAGERGGGGGGNRAAQPAAQERRLGGRGAPPATRQSEAASGGSRRRVVPQPPVTHLSACRRAHSTRPAQAAPPPDTVCDWRRSDGASAAVGSPLSAMVGGAARGGEAGAATRRGGRRGALQRRWGVGRRASGWRGSGR